MSGAGFDLVVPFVRHLGFDLLHWGDGAAELAYTAAPEHLNSFGVTHGGACMTLLDVAMACAARSVDRSLGVVTVEMKTSFLQPAQGPLRAQARLLHRSSTLAFCEATLRDAQGRPCAHATGTFKYLRRLPVGVGAVQPLARDGAAMPGGANPTDG